MFSDALHAPAEIAKSDHDVRRRGVTFLRNAKIDHVSIVKLGANGRRFTIVKSLSPRSADPFRNLERALVAWLK